MEFVDMLIPVSVTSDYFSDAETSSYVKKITEFETGALTYEINSFFSQFSLENYESLTFL
jgi:hypothetical protein